MGSLKLLSEACHESFAKNSFRAFNFPFLNHKPCMVQYVSSGKATPRSVFLHHIRNIVPRCDKSCEGVPTLHCWRGRLDKLLIFYCNLSTLLWCPEPHRRAMYQATWYKLFGPHDYYSRGRTAPEKVFPCYFNFQFAHFIAQRW